jgi:predicted  nucleic acid-binding Zn-ribbon protein
VETTAMKLEVLVHSVESRLFRLGRTLLQADEKSELREEMDLAQLEMATREKALARAEGHCDEVRERVKTLQSQAEQMTGQIESSYRRGKRSQALRQAMELETIRRDLIAAQAELPRLEQTVWSIGFNLRQMRRRMERIREQISGR